VQYFAHKQIGKAEHYFAKAENMMKTEFPSNVIKRLELYYDSAKIFYIHNEYRLSYQAIQKGLNIKPDYYYLLQLQTKVIKKLYPYGYFITQIFTDDILKLQTLELKYLSFDDLQIYSFRGR